MNNSFKNFFFDVYVYIKAFTSALITIRNFFHRKYEFAKIITSALIIILKGNKQ